MTRMQVLLAEKEVKALRRVSAQSGKSYSMLVREAIDNAYLSRFTEDEIAGMAKEAKQGQGVRKFQKLQAARRHLWSL